MTHERATNCFVLFAVTLISEIEMTKIYVINIYEFTVFVLVIKKILIAAVPTVLVSSLAICRTLLGSDYDGIVQKSADLLFQFNIVNPQL